jgi:hypothetical protein
VASTSNSKGDLPYSQSVQARSGSLAAPSRTFLARSSSSEIRSWSPLARSRNVGGETPTAMRMKLALSRLEAGEATLAASSSRMQAESASKSPRFATRPINSKRVRAASARRKSSSADEPAVSSDKPASSSNEPAVFWIEPASFWIEPTSSYSGSIR